MIGYDFGTIDARPVNTVATYTCVSGYMLDGGMTRTCEATGEWSGTDLTCECESIIIIIVNATLPDVLITSIAAVDCNGLSNPTDGMVALTTTTFDSTATYSCNTGLSLNGEATRTCEETGAWSGSAPTCVGMLSLCSLPTQVTY